MRFMVGTVHGRGLLGGDDVARRGNRTDQYRAIAGFYGMALVQDLHNPSIPEFVLVRAARLAGHYGVAALGMADKHAGRSARSAEAAAGRLLASRRAARLARRAAVQAIEGSTLS